MNSPTTILRDYLALRRSLGFQLKKHESVLRGLVKLLATRKESYLTTEIALQWARKPKGTDPAWATDRLSMIRGFAAYWKAIDPRTEVPPQRLLLPYYKRPAPHIYADNEIKEIMLAARDLPSKDSLTYWTLFGLLIVTGARSGEILAMADDDVDLKRGVIHIRNGKRGKSRVLPLHDSTRNVLQRYRRWRHCRFSHTKSDSFSMILDGRRPTHHMAWSTFKKILVGLSILESMQAKGPRLHDLRHTFAVRALIRQYREGKDVGAGIQALSNYLGHVSIVSTYWYLQAVPELMALALARMENMAGGAL